MPKFPNTTRDTEDRARKSSRDQELCVYEVSWAMRPVQQAPRRSQISLTNREQTDPQHQDENNEEMLDVYNSVIEGILHTNIESGDGFQTVRNQLAARLIHHTTVKSRELRLRVLKHFQAQGKEFRQHLGLSRLLDVILDEDMDLVEIPFKDENAGEYFDDHILPILVNRCASLKTLHLQCSGHVVGYWET